LGAIDCADCCGRRFAIDRCNTWRVGDCCQHSTGITKFSLWV